MRARRQKSWHQGFLSGESCACVREKRVSEVEKALAVAFLVFFEGKNQLSLHARIPLCLKDCWECNRVVCLTVWNFISDAPLRSAQKGFSRNSLILNRQHQKRNSCCAHKGLSDFNRTLLLVLKLRPSNMRGEFAQNSFTEVGEGREQRAKLLSLSLTVGCLGSRLVLLALAVACCWCPLTEHLLPPFN